MNRRTTVLVIVWLIASVLIAWSASLPDLSYEIFGVESGDLPYKWEYPFAVFLFGAILITLIRPWREEHSAAGSMAAFLLSAAVFVYLGITSMHQPLVHGHAFLLMLFVSQVTLFYSGYAFALRRRGHDT